MSQGPVENFGTPTFGADRSRFDSEQPPEILGNELDSAGLLMPNRRSAQAREKQVPPLRRRVRSGSGRNDKMVVRIRIGSDRNDKIIRIRGVEACAMFGVRWSGRRAFCCTCTHVV
jgi:hypothetical protein